MTTPNPNQAVIDNLTEASLQLDTSIERVQAVMASVLASIALIDKALDTLTGPPPSPMINLVPATGGPGARVAVHGFHLSPAGARVFVLIERQHMFSSTVRDDGEFHGELTLPNFLPGVIDVYIVYESDPEVVVATKFFVVTEAPTPPATLAVTNFKVSTNRGVLDNAGLGVGRLVYADRTYTYIDPIPPEVAGGVLIRTANDDANNDAPNYITFNVNRPVNVYILYDAREAAELPAWLTQGWVKTNLIVRTTEVHGTDRMIFKKGFPAGVVTLPGAGSAPNNWVGSNMAGVIKAA